MAALALELDVGKDLGRVADDIGAVHILPLHPVSQGVSGAGTYVVGTPCTGSASVHWEVVCFAEIP